MTDLWFINLGRFGDWINPRGEGNIIRALWTIFLAGVGVLNAEAQPTLPLSSRVTPDLTKPGFVWRVFANPANTDNSLSRAEAALAGLLKDAAGNPLPNRANPAARGAAIAPSFAPIPTNAPIEFLIESAINLSQTQGDGNGAFTPDLQMPGIPTLDQGNDGIAAEILTFLELRAGVITMGVNSDEGFRASAGNLHDVFQGLVLGEFDGGRANADTIFSFTVQEAGVYPFRILWEEGEGGASIEWFTVKADGAKSLVNDFEHGGIKAYRAATAGPRDPYVQSVKPGRALRQLNQAESAVEVVLHDGDNAAIDDASIDLKIDGKDASGKKRDGRTVTLTYAPERIQFPSESHTAELAFKGTGGFSRVEKWNFRNWKNVVLPATVVTENFDAVAEGGQPAGWVATNFTVGCKPGEDITDQKSDTYKNWVVIGTATIPLVDQEGIESVNPTEKLNGKPLTIAMLRSGKVLYAESDRRCSGESRQEVLAGIGDSFGQTQFIVSPAFNLSTVKDPMLSFGCGYVQNQDSFGGVEYSVDGGNAWLPVVYFLDSADIILKNDGSVDGMKTLNATQSDSSLWTVKGVVKGKSFGDAIAAPINDAIGDYIVPRVDDNSTEGKRIEIFRLPAAANKADVRLRFLATGSDSYYFFIDNLAFQDVPPDQNANTTTPPKLTYGIVVGGLKLYWDGVGKLESAEKVVGPWSLVTGAGSGYQVNSSAGIATYFRVRQ
ncbi:MAG: hypothetical protein EXS31_16730 [Pedosphaera sp.]|nr:hypothetical protein [Pedosphaera sp.]